MLPDELFELADRALYRAKEGGRNRVEVEVAGEGDRATQTIRLLIAGAVGTTTALSQMLAGADGLQVVGAADGPAQAVELAGLRRPDVVLLDFDMPSGSSYRAAIRHPRGPARRADRRGLEGPQPRRATGHVAGRGRRSPRAGRRGEEIVRTVRSAFLY